MSGNDKGDTKQSASPSKSQGLRDVFRRAHAYLTTKLSRDASENKDGNGTGSSKKSETKRPPSNQEIQEAIHEYNYPDVSLLRKEFSRPPAPDISTLPKRKEKRDQGQRTGNKFNNRKNRRSLSAPELNEREKEVPISRTNVSMKARLFENLDTGGNSNEYLYPTTSPKPIQKRPILPGSKPLAAQTPFPVKPMQTLGTKAEASGNHNARNIPTSPKPAKISNKTPKPWKLPSHQNSNINSPPHYVDTEVVSVNPVKEKLVEKTQTKFRPVGKVVGKISPISEESEEQEPYYSGKLFSELSVVEVVECLRKCGLREMADICQSEKLDGSFISQLSQEELKELNLSPIQIMKLSKVKRGWRPKTTEFSLRDGSMDLK